MTEKFMIYLARKAGETPEDFRGRYLQEHAPQILALPGIRHYTANLALEIPPVLTPESGFGNPGSGVDAVDELWCRESEGPLPLEVPLSLYEKDFTVVGAYRTLERIIVDHPTDWEVGKPSPWLKRLAFLGRVEEMSHEEFGVYWKERHGPLAAETHRIAVKYVQNLIEGTLTASTKPWDGIVQMHFWSVDEFVRGFFPDPESRDIIMRDVRKFIGHWGEARPAWLLQEYIMK